MFITPQVPKKIQPRVRIRVHRPVNLRKLQQQGRPIRPRYQARPASRNIRRKAPIRFRVFIFVILGAIILSASGALLYFTYFQKAYSVAKLLPQDAGLYLSFNTDPKDPQNQTFDGLYEGFSAKKILSHSLERSIRNIFALSDLNYSEDVRPWLGNEIAFTKVSSDEESKIVLFAQVRSTREAKKVLERVQSRIKGGSARTETRTYNGVLYNVFSAGGEDIFVTFLKGYVIGALKEDELKTVIDVSKKDLPSLTTNATYIRTQKQLPESSVLSVYVNLIPFLRDSIEQSPEIQQKLKELGQDHIDFNQISEGKYTGIGGALTAQEKGFDAKIFMNKDQEAHQPKQQSSSQYKYFPKGSKLVVEVSTIEQLIRTIYPLLGSDDLLFSNNNQDNDESFRAFLQDMKNKYNIDFPTDLFPLGERGISFGLLPNNDKVQGDFGLILESQNSQNMREQMKRLEGFFQQLAFQTEQKQASAFLETTYQGVIVRYLQIPLFDISVNYAILGENVFISSSKQGIRSLIDVAQGRSESLASDLNFSDAYKQLSPDQSSIVYIDIMKMFFGESDTSESLINNLTGPGAAGQTIEILLQFFQSSVFTRTSTPEGDLYSGFLLTN